MCGNGIRCVAKFAHDRLGVRDKPMRVETGRGVLAIDYEVEDGRLTLATVDMGEPILEADQIPVDLPRGEPRQHIIDGPLDHYIPMNAPAAWMSECDLDMHMTCVSMGNPHVVIFCGVPEAVPLSEIGPFIERQPIFPNRVNVHVVSVTSPGEATMRTWERGTGITLACGTGASAVLVAGVLTGRLEREALLHLPGGDLTIRWDEASNHVFQDRAGNRRVRRGLARRALKGAQGSRGSPDSCPSLMRDAPGHETTFSTKWIATISALPIGLVPTRGRAQRRHETGESSRAPADAPQAPGLACADRAGRTLQEKAST